MQKEIYSTNENENGSEDYEKEDDENKLYSNNKLSRLELSEIKNELLIQKKNLTKRLFYFWIFIIIVSFIFYFRYSIPANQKNKTEIKIYYDNDTTKLPKPKEKIEDKTINKLNNANINKYMTNNSSKIGVAFVFESMFGNGIGRMLSILFNELSKFEKYDLYLITKGTYRLDFKYDKKVKTVNIYGNKTEIEKFNKNSNVKYYVLQNELDANKINWYKSLGKKVIDIMHGVYLSSVYSNSTGVYKVWKNHFLFDAYIQVIADDYYVYKKLGMNNTFYIPNMYTYDASKTPNSNLTYKNLMIMGRENDRIKGGYYGIKAMYEIVKEVPDAKLYFISSDYRINSLKGVIEELNLTKNIEIVSYVENISLYFLNSSVLLYPSKSESFPMVMNEGKAHGLPIVAFNVSYSPSYQKGVILVDMLNYTQMGKEAIKLLKDYDYRKRKGMEAKLSLNEYSNEETANKWDKLFSILDKDDPIAYKKLQEYTYEKYYDEEKARERLESNYNFGKKYNKYFCCHTFNDMLNLTYLNNIKGCKNQSLCK